MPNNTKVTLILDGEKNDFTMDSDCNILDEGFILTCISKPDSEEITIDFDDV